MTHSCLFTYICIRLACNDRTMPIFAFCAVSTGNRRVTLRCDCPYDSTASKDLGVGGWSSPWPLQFSLYLYIFKTYARERRGYSHIKAVRVYANMLYLKPTIFFFFFFFFFFLALKAPSFSSIISTATFRSKLTYACHIGESVGGGGGGGTRR